MLHRVTHPYDNSQHTQRNGEFTNRLLQNQKNTTSCRNLQSLEIENTYIILKYYLSNCNTIRVVGRLMLEVKE